MNDVLTLSKFHYRLIYVGRIKQTETELLLKNTVSDDSGVYQCIASNKYGSVSASSHLHVIGSLYQPPPPMGLRCTSLNSTEILVSWELSPHDSAEQPPIIIKSQDPDAMDNPDMYQERVSIQPMIRKAYSVHCFPTGKFLRESFLSFFLNFLFLFFYYLLRCLVLCSKFELEIYLRGGNFFFKQL